MGNTLLHAITLDPEVHGYVHVQKSNQRAQLMTVHKSTTVGDLKCAIFQRDNVGGHLGALMNGGAQEHMKIRRGGPSRAMASRSTTRWRSNFDERGRAKPRE